MKDSKRLSTLRWLILLVRSKHLFIDGDGLLHQPWHKLKELEAEQNLIAPK